MVRGEVEMDEKQRQKIINELNDFYKGLRSYKNRQSKRQETGFSEPQIRSLDALRLKLQREYGRLKESISKYGGTRYISRLGERHESFHYILSSLDIKNGTFIALDGAISAVNEAIGKLESTPITELELQEVRVPESPKAFIAHGGDSPALRKLKSFLEALGVQPLVVEEQPSEGRSIGENVDWYARQSDFAIILATKGDVNGKTGGFIPRGNVLMEIGKLQELFKDRIVYLLQAGTKLPTNISEKVRERFTPQSMDNTFIKIAKELNKFGILKVVKLQEEEQNLV